MKTKDLIAAAKLRRGIPSNYRLARELDVPEKTVQRWHTGKNVPGGKYATKLAELAEMDPDYVAAALRAETVADPDEKAVWERIAARLSRLMAVCAAVILSLFITGGPNGGAMAATPGAAPAVSSVDNQGGQIYIVDFCTLRPFFGLFVHFLRVLSLFRAIPAQRDFCQA